MGTYPTGRTLSVGAGGSALNGAPVGRMVIMGVECAAFGLFGAGRGGEQIQVGDGALLQNVPQTCSDGIGIGGEAEIGGAGDGTENPGGSG